ncbi:hypothetical protein Taro_056875 [Colocasia esculenta]|uniref:Uncharacterized protein n=1 Tax=Colocasia esculenta TaxID=4460 RepID=A0A843XYQ4_COLES|nr:hypothetical protein [Colocasia esculenta]
MFQDVSSCNTYDYGNALYWDARYIEEGGASFDWYQRYSALRPIVRRFVPTSSRVLMVGCGNAVMSEDMVKDGYEEIMNIDISSVMDVRDMSFFPDESFDSVIDKARPGFESSAGCTLPTKSYMEPVLLTESGLLPVGFAPEDPDSHYVYVCHKMQGLTGLAAADIEQVRGKCTTVENCLRLPEIPL